MIHSIQQFHQINLTKRLNSSVSRTFVLQGIQSFNQHHQSPRSWFTNEARSNFSEETQLFKKKHSQKNNLVYLGLGSNLGNRLKNISKAINSLSNFTQVHQEYQVHNTIQLLDSSFVYQSEPMYLTDQPEFLNAVCKISTCLSPDELLKLIKKIELEQGRNLENVPRNSPRPIDIDILMFNSDIIQQSNLSIPHIGMLERQFVLEPLADIAKQVIHPLKKCTIYSLLLELKKATRSTVRKAQLITAEGCPTLDLSARTHLMSIVNCTPDSFSDGGTSYLLQDAISKCLEHISEGADILDIGGMSTRPGATDVSVEEEINRTIPVIRALREQHKIKCHISIDTFRSETAEAAIKAGATLVNDVSAGLADQKMYKTVAKLDVPYVMMHMRGDSRNMNQLTRYIDSDVVHGVQQELAHCVQNALNSGIKRWNIIVDPGFGFAKDFKGNCQLLNSLDQLQQPRQLMISSSKTKDEGETKDNILNGFPLLVGLSRKKFLGQLLISKKKQKLDDKSNLSIEIPSPDERLIPTIAASVISILKGAQLIRAHDTKIIKQVIDTVDGIQFFGRL